jgi:AraC family transcriptional regulator
VALLVRLTKQRRLSGVENVFVDRRIATAIRIMHRDRRRKLPVRDLAKQVHLSVWHFTRLFKAETSVSPSYYMRSIKVKEAQQLLDGTFLSVKEIAAHVGFGDRSHFSRDFKKLCGQSPSRFRTTVE